MLLAWQVHPDRVIAFARWVGAVIEEPGVVQVEGGVAGASPGALASAGRSCKRKQVK